MYWIFGKELLDWLSMGTVHIILMSSFVFTSFHIDEGVKIRELTHLKFSPRGGVAGTPWGLDI